MSVTIDAGQDDRPGHDERADERVTEPAPATTLGDAVDGPRSTPPDARRDRRQTRPRARRQAVRRDRRQPLIRWADRTTQLVLGTAVFLAVGLGVGADLLLTGWSRGGAAPAARYAGQRPDRRVRSGPSAADPLAVAMLQEPQVSPQLIEANGPVGGCSILPSLASLRTRIGPNLVGECVEDALVPVGADARQRTTGGELIWRRADARASFTDGHETWLEGPDGIVRRHNHERYAWEPDENVGPRPQKTTFALPPPLPGAILPARRIVSYYGNPLSATWASWASSAG